VEATMRAGRFCSLPAWLVGIIGIGRYARKFAW
jgi:hypothetical protein